MQWSHATILLGLCLACAAQRGSRRFNPDQPLEESLSVQNHRFQGRSRSDGVEDVSRGTSRRGRTQDTTEENHRSFTPRSRSKPEDAPRTFHSRRQEVSERATAASLEGRGGRFESQTNSRARNQNVENNRGRGRTETVKEPTRSVYEIPNQSKLSQKSAEANIHESTKSIPGQNRANVEQEPENIQELAPKSNVPDAIVQNADSVTNENSPKIQHAENNERIEEPIKSLNPISQDTFTEASQQRQSNRDETKTKQLEEHSGRHSKTEDVRRKNAVSAVSDRADGTLPRNELTSSRRRGGESLRRVGSLTRKNVIDEPKSDQLESTRRVDSFVRRNRLDESERSREEVPRRTDFTRRRSGEESRRNDEANPRKFYSFPSRSGSQDTTSDGVQNSRTPDSIPRRGRLLSESKENRENPRRGSQDEPRPSGVEPSRRTELVSRRSGLGDFRENRRESFTRRGSEDRKGDREEGARRIDTLPRQSTSTEPREKQVELPRKIDAFARSGVPRRVDLLPKNRKLKEPVQNGLPTEFPKRSNDVEESTRASRKLDSDLSTTVKSNTVVDFSTRNSILEDPSRRLEVSLSKDSEPPKITSEDRRPIYSRRGAATRDGKESINQDSPLSRRTQGFRSRSKEEPVQPALGEARKRPDFSSLNRSRDRFTSRPSTATSPDVNTTPETLSSSVPEPSTEGGIEDKNEITIPSPSEAIYPTIDRAPATATAAGTLPRRPNRGRGHFTPSKHAENLVLTMWRNSTVAHQLKVSESQSVTLEKIKRKPKIINKKDNSGEVKDDDNYPEVYKQLKKSGSDPKEILALLKARKEAREKIEKTKNNIPEIDASRKPSSSSKKEIDEEIKTERTTESRGFNPRTNSRRKFYSYKSEIETEKSLSNQSKYTTSSPDPSGKINKNVDEFERKSSFRSSSRFKTDREISPRPAVSEQRGLYRKRTETFNSNNKDEEDQRESHSSYRRRNRYTNNESKTIKNNSINDKLNNNHNVEQEIKNEETNDEESQFKEKKPFEDPIKAQILRHKTLKQEERHKYVPEINKKLYSSKYRADKETTEEIATIATYTERVKVTYVPRNRNRDYENFKLRTEKPVDFISVQTPIRPKHDLYKRKDPPNYLTRGYTTERTEESTYQLGQFVPKSRPTYVPPKRKYGKATTPTPFSRYRDRKTSLSKILNTDDDLKLDNSEDYKLTVDYDQTDEDVRPNINALSIHSLVTESSQSAASTESSVLGRNRPSYSGSHIQRVPPKKKSDVTTILPMTTLYPESESGGSITQDLEQANDVESSTFGNSDNNAAVVASESSENEEELLTISTTEPTTTTTSTTTTPKPTTRLTTKPKVTTRKTNKPTTRKVTTKATTITTTTTQPSTTTTQPTTTTTEPTTLLFSITTTTTEATTPLTKSTTTTTTKKLTITTTTKKPTTITTTTKKPTTTTTTTRKPTTTTTPTTKKPTTTTTKPTTTTTTKIPTSTTTQPATSQKSAIITTTKKPTPKTTKKPVATTTTKKKVETPTTTIRTTSTLQSTTLIPGILPRIGNPSTIENEIPLNFDIVTPTTHPTFLSTVAYLARNFTPTPTTIPNLVNTADIRTTTSPPENTSNPRGNYVVYGLLPNNNVVRKVIRTTQAPVDLPFIIYGLYPNGTIVRRFPNGTILPDETEEEENEIIANVEPGSQESLENVVKKDNPLSYLYPLGGSSPTTPKTVYIPSTSPSTSTVPSIDVRFGTPPLIPLTIANVTPSSTIESNVKATSAATTPKPSVTPKPSSTTARKPAPTTKPSTTTTVKPVAKTTAKQKSSKSTTKSATTTSTTTTTTKPTTPSTTTPKPTTSSTTTPKPTTTATVKLSTAKTTVQTTKRKTTPTKPKTTTTKAKTQATTPKTTSTTSKISTSPVAKSQATSTTIRTTTKSSTTPVAKSQATSTTIRTTTNKSKNSSNGKNKPKTTKEPLSDAEILNTLVKQGAIGNIPISTTENSIELADKVIKLAIERAQKSTSSSLLQDPADLQTLSSTASPVTKTATGESVNSTDASQGTNRTGKISVWIIPPEDGNSTNHSDTGSTVSPTDNELLASLLSSPNAIENLPLQEQLLLAEVLSSTTFPQTTTKKKKKKRPKTTTTTTTPPPPFPVLQYIFGRNRGGGGLFQGGLLRGLGLRGLTSGDTPQEIQPAGIFQSDSTASSQNIETSTEPQQEAIQQGNGLVGAAINVSRAVSQFMGFVIQGAAQSFQNYLQSRTRALAEALANPPPVS